MPSRLQLLSDCATTLQALQESDALEGGPVWREIGLEVVAEFVRVLQTYPRLQGVLLTWNKVDQEYGVSFQFQAMDALARDDLEVYQDIDRVRNTVNRALSRVAAGPDSGQEPFLKALFERLADHVLVDHDALAPMLHRVAGSEGMAVMRQVLLEDKLASQSDPVGPKVRL